MDLHTTGVFFSPTGGTRRALESFLRLFDPAAARLDATCPPERLAPVRLGPGDVLVLAFPVYAGQVPAVPGLFSQLRGDGTPCVLLACYGNRHYDDALAQMARRLEEQGFVCVGAAACVTPHIFAPALGAGRPDQTDLAALKTLADAVRRKLCAGGNDAVRLPGNPAPAPKAAVPVPKTRDAARCTRCGACARDCPVGAIAPDLQLDPARCISCMHCVALCPAGALRFDAGALEKRLTGAFSARREVELFL